MLAWSANVVKRHDAYLIELITSKMVRTLVRKVNSAGQFHCEDGPAIVSDSGYQAWCFNGKAHRIGGPAITHSNGRTEWRVHGEYSSPDDPIHTQASACRQTDDPHNTQLDAYKQETYARVRYRDEYTPKKGNSRPVVTENGDTYWYTGDVIHRDVDPVLGQLPAIECANGTRYWMKMGVLHREPDPVFGELPAVEYPNGDKEWWYDGNFITSMTSDDTAVTTVEEAIADTAVAMATNGVAVVSYAPASCHTLKDKTEWRLCYTQHDPQCGHNHSDGSELGVLHRVDGPAIEWNNGAIEWWLNGNRHREDGPALVYSYIENDQLVTIREWWTFGVLSCKTRE